jgi:tripartite-type tricarboxylate transporter receptor subunit TctC
MARIAFALLSLLFIQQAVQAQAYPARSVRIIVPIDQFDKFLREDITKWAGVVKATGMKVD